MFKLPQNTLSLLTITLLYMLVPNYWRTSFFANFTLGSLNAQTISNISSAQSVFATILPQLKSKTKIPIYLPSYIPELNESTPIYANLESVNRSKYVISLAFTQDCNGGNACRLGSIRGEVIPLKQIPLTGKKIALKNGYLAYFTEAKCGANCSDSTLVWQDKNTRYTFAIKASDLNTLVKMANSVYIARK